MKLTTEFIHVRLFVSLMIFMLTSVTIVIAVSVPEGPSSLTVAASSRRTVNTANSTLAYAGNITSLVLNGKTVTQTWQGFVGNVTGTVTLEDSANYVLYNWSQASPKGEVYATTISAPNFSTGSIQCWNYSAGDTLNYLGLEAYEGWGNLTTIPGYTSGVYLNLSVRSNDPDGVNETFPCYMCNSSPSIPAVGQHSGFYIGGQQITGNTVALNGACPLVKLYNSSYAPSFEEVLLYQGTGPIANNGVIYASILKNSEAGYNGVPWDFEMLVGVNGHNGNTSTVPYYFFVELE